jgi:hypothetical protein
MTSEQFPHQPGPAKSARTLKIEADGDFWKNRAKPKIRLMGRWLEGAGFKPGDRVQVIVVAPGVIELRCPAMLPANGEQQHSNELSDLELR